ncbi:6,7-dimethyl-8-ribityllumazine synthase [Aquiluna sp. KACHI24]|uniref:6,7-dimethyl-8-ribityllumazine synthase n=1 Tax=Aquiluna sp. KACHI24 TaxID=2968831 RepID=UPI0021FF6163|nr:6,7-dimethyl-8-ribityllumazine synthase [Aquiluna sp. KACHI24]BDP99906.1 6,7-dimethyl-8-ribityllumazine synthase [Aquiluna sp. KACHI24]
MSGSGAPQLEVSAAGKKIYVVATSWHTRVMDGLVLGAMRELEKAGAEDVQVHKVPGAFELPLAAKWAFDQGADAVIALGVVIQGETPHFDYVCDSATTGLTQVQLEYGKPIGFGLLTVDDEAQAIARAGLEGSKEDKGAESVQAALHMLSLIS